MTTVSNPLQPALTPLSSGLSDAILSCSVDRIFPTIESALQRIMPHDYAAIAFRDLKEGGHLRRKELSYQSESVTVQETLLPRGRTPSGWVLAHRKPLLVSKLDRDRFAHPLEIAQAGIRFGCWIPLICGERAVGVLLVGSREDSGLEQRVPELLALSPQIAGAFQITERFQQLAVLANQLQEEKSYFEEQVRRDRRLEKVLGGSSGFARVMARARTAATVQQTVLITGERGTEKELIAGLIHRLSPRQRQAFIRVNCAGQQANLLAKNLFGYQEESMEGSSFRRVGWLELAHRGTLFLEEVSDLPLELQSRLLGALHERRLTRREGQSGTQLDVRVIASTSRDLWVLVNSGKFDAELYRWLTVFPFQILPLRKRADDIPLLVNHYVSKFAKQMNKTIDSISQETMSLLAAGRWPGNTRELEIFIERAVMRTTGTTFRVPLIDLDAPQEENLQTAERKHILRVLRATKGMIGGPNGAAKKLGVKRTTLNSKLKKLGIERATYR
jgi:formate hydrogenlyase transcriptional activator